MVREQGAVGLKDFGAKDQVQRQVFDDSEAVEDPQIRDFDGEVSESQQSNSLSVAAYHLHATRRGEARAHPEQVISLMRHEVLRGSGVG